MRGGGGSSLSALSLMSFASGYSVNRIQIHILPKGWVWVCGSFLVGDGAEVEWESMTGVA